ncbi:hypothetical protein BE04_42065 [Sorangium cellulosum]|uniref:SMP-30/Gluconolactonase/LRE-like region domain-containing protein n=2 Tax=Sorangium cellulosum TaxID=56 RepID=A0A150TGN5_SORCE|nr:hypothetical protein [Sorangium cellulosum]AGP38785.1 hypothetical protein SCE1572_32455 [Sorangium cellulosum So0157-2]KYF65022.1 hypothetical protein BE04_42065 [Sorangium cellulosum]KYG03822.1 hypothetical protein BE21_04335 [Sorangium cellulosum]
MASCAALEPETTEADNAVRSHADEGACPEPSIQDTLFIGDNGDFSVKAFSVDPWMSLTYTGSPFVEPAAGGLHGVMGLIFGRNRNLLAVNQNVELPINGEVLEFDGADGRLIRSIVASSDPDSPFAPRGMVLRDNVLYVADFGGYPNVTQEGQVALYHGRTGELLGKLDADGLTTPFFPRGVVFGPDGKLYVSNVPKQTSGQVLRFDPRTRKLIDVFIDSGKCKCDFNRPEGLVFGPGTHPRLYVTSFPRDEDDTDKILVFDQRGEFVDSIELYRAGEPRASAQALLFGPGGRLYLPLTQFSAPEHQGEVRRYDVGTKMFEVVVPSFADGGPLQAGWYLTFRRTNPATLVYEGD